MRSGDVGRQRDACLFNQLLMKRMWVGGQNGAWMKDFWVGGERIRIPVQSIPRDCWRNMLQSLPCIETRPSIRRLEWAN
jgi:hypothetical protein